MGNVRSIKARHANGDVEECSIQIVRDSQYKLIFSGAGFQEQKFSSSDQFGALMLLRLELEKINVQLLCNGARRDVFPSGMGRDMGGGNGYLMKLGCRASSADLVGIFEYSDDPSLGSVAEQLAFRKEWRESLQEDLWSAGKDFLIQYLKSKGWT